MRTITFEVEVDDNIFDTMVPSINDDAAKEASDGRLFLCKNKTSVAKKLVRLHRDVTAEGNKESSWFESWHLPDEMRIVVMTGGNAVEYVQAPANSEAHDNEANERISTYTLHEDHRAIIETVCGLSNVIDLINENVLNLMQNQDANRDYMDAKFEEAFKHFKQVHQEHLDDCTHFAEIEEHLIKHIKDGYCHAANTANTVGHNILRALPEPEDRIKEYIGEPDPAQSSLAGNAPSGDGSNQALLRALDLLATVIKK